MAHGTRHESAKLAAAYLQYDRRFQKMMLALARLRRLDVLDRERLAHTRLVLEHSRARIALDTAEALQQSELEICNEIDRKLRAIEKIVGLERIDRL